MKNYDVAAFVYFCTLFKKAFSVTPSNYKALYLKNKPR